MFIIELSPERIQYKLSQSVYVKQTSWKGHLVSVHQRTDECKFKHVHYKIVNVNKNLSARFIVTYSPWLVNTVSLDQRLVDKQQIHLILDLQYIVLEPHKYYIFWKRLEMQLGPHMHFPNKLMTSQF